MEPLKWFAQSTIEKYWENFTIKTSCKQSLPNLLYGHKTEHRTKDTYLTP